MGFRGVSGAFEGWNIWEGKGGRKRGEKEEGKGGINRGKKEGEEGRKSGGV